MNKESSWAEFEGKHKEMFKECLPPESRQVFTKVINTAMGGKLLKRCEATTKKFVNSAHDYGFLRGLVIGKKAVSSESDSLLVPNQHSPQKHPSSEPAILEGEIKNDEVERNKNPVSDKRE